MRIYQHPNLAEPQRKKKHKISLYKNDSSCIYSGLLILKRGDFMLNSDHIQMIQKALETSENQLEDIGDERLTYAKEELKNAISHMESTDHPFLTHSIYRK